MGDDGAGADPGPAPNDCRSDDDGIATHLDAVFEGHRAADDRRGIDRARGGPRLRGALCCQAVDEGEKTRFGLEVVRLDVDEPVLPRHVGRAEGGAQVDEGVE